MDETHLHILWTSADPVTAEKMVLMYATNSLLQGWWQEVTVILWGAAARVPVDHPLVAEKMRLAAHAGVQFSACRACAEQLGVAEALDALGVEVVYWGPRLTELLRTHAPLLTV